MDELISSVHINIYCFDVLWYRPMLGAPLCISLDHYYNIIQSFMLNIAHFGYNRYELYINKAPLSHIACILYQSGRIES